MNRTAVLTFPDRGLAQQVPVSYRTTSGSVDGADPLRQAFSVQNEATIFYDIATGRVRSGEPYVFNPSYRTVFRSTAGDEHEGVGR